MASPVIAPDGTIYVGSGSLQTYDVPAKLWSISPQGSTNWARVVGKSGPGGISPALGIDGSIYFGPTEQVASIHPNGTTNWLFKTGAQHQSSPAIGADGSIYFYAVSGTTNLAYSVRPDGITNWMRHLGGAAPKYISTVQFPAPAIGPDGSIYMAVISGELCSLSGSGQTNWVYALPTTTYSSPAVGPDGTIYLGCDDGKVYAVDPLGQKKWSFQTPSQYVESSPTVSASGRIYAGGADSAGGIFELRPQGSLQWMSYLGGVSASVAVAADGSFIVASYGLGTISAYSTNHALLWSYAPPSSSIFSSPVIATNGTVYIGAGTKLYAIHNTNGLQSGAWPMFRRDTGHQARSIQRSIRGVALASDGFLMQLMTETGRVYAIEASTDLNVWTEWTNFVPSTVTNEVRDPSALALPSRYYRLRSPN